MTDTQTIAGGGTERTDDSVPKRLGDYEIMGELGRGGMGTVYRARQVSMNRVVALKVLPSFAGMDREAVARFRREAEAAGRLAHPGIVPVHAVGCAEGTHYFAMDLVEGPPLAELIDRVRGSGVAALRRPLMVEAGVAVEETEASPSDAADHRYARSCAGLAADVANALATAHANRIIHRDIKPSNILIHPSGHPLLADFGLARDELETGLTMTGAQLGTPAYMAPEQIFDGSDVDARADIYGLGATLYEMLALRPVFVETNPNELVQCILDTEPTPLRKLNPRVPPELELIVQTCLAKDPDDRYPAIEAVEIDLRSFLLGRRILARPPNPWQRLVRVSRRLRRNTAAVATALVATIGIAVTAGIVQSNRSHREGVAALAEARRELLENSNPSRAEQHYGRAEALLGPAAVRGTRVEHAHAAFERFYPSDLELLRGLARSWSDVERAELADLIERLDGRGVVDVTALSAGGRGELVAEYRAGRSGVLDPTWVPLPVDGRLPIGDYLVRVTRPNTHAQVYGVRVRREQIVSLRTAPYPIGMVPDGTVPVVDPESGLGFAMARTELSLSDYLALLAGDRMRDELVPANAETHDAGGNELPVRGLSYHQARTAAALLGGHLPSTREFWLAASGGLPSLRYPWGGEFASERLVADPHESLAPEPVTSHESGASPLGILHLLGNVAEIIERSPNGRLAAAGGHFQSLTPEQLVLTDQGGLLHPLAGPAEPNRFAGMRVARFLPPPDDHQDAVAARDALEAVARTKAGAIHHTWAVRRDGLVDYRLMINGFAGTAGDRAVLPLVTTGFLQGATLNVRDGHGRALGAERALSAYGEASRLEIATRGGRRAGARYRLEFDTVLTPAAGLRPEGEGYTLRVPMKSAGPFAAAHSLRLPPGCRITSVDPEPAYTFHENGAPNVVWILSSDGRQRVLPAVVRFRADGMLTSEWSSRSEASAFVENFFRACEAGDGGTLARLKHSVYREQAFATAAAGGVSGTAVRWTMIDAMAVGPVVTVDLVVDWELGEGAILRSWPLQLQLLRTEQGLRALRLRSAARADAGTLEGGVYHHPRLRVTIRQAEGVLLSRSYDELSDMQVMYVHPTADHVRLQVLGHFAADEDTSETMRARLTAGALGESVQREPVAGLAGEVPAPRGTRREDWLVRSDRGWTREQWTTVMRGRRTFLFKATAWGETRQQATQQFNAVAAWFGEMSKTVRIE